MDRIVEDNVNQTAVEEAVHAEVQRLTEETRTMDKISCQSLII